MTLNNYQQQESSNNFRDSITLSLNDSFFHDKGKDTTVEEYFQNIDERLNIKVASGMKKVLQLVIRKLDVLIQDKVKFIVKDEVHQILNDRKNNNRERCSSKLSYTQFNGVRKPPKSPGNHRNAMSKDTSFEGDLLNCNKIINQRQCSTRDKMFLGVKSPLRSQVSKADEFYDTTAHRQDERPMTMPTTPKHRPFRLSQQNVDVTEPGTPTSIKQKKLNKQTKKCANNSKQNSQTISQVKLNAYKSCVKEQQPQQQQQQKPPQYLQKKTVAKKKPFARQSTPRVISDSVRMHKANTSKGQNVAVESSVHEKLLKKRSSSRHLSRTRQSNVTCKNKLNTSRVTACESGKLKVNKSKQLDGNKMSLLLNDKKNAEVHTSKRTFYDSIKENNNSDVKKVKSLNNSIRNLHDNQKPVTSNRQDHQNLKHVQRRGINLIQDQIVNSTRKLIDKNNSICQTDETPIGKEMGAKQLNKSKPLMTDKKTHSSNYDEVDDIYFEKDPIATSLIQRKKAGGLLTSTVKNLNSKSGKYFFALKLKQQLSSNEYSTYVGQCDLKSSTTSNTPGMFNTLRNFTNTSLKVKVDFKRQNSPSNINRNIFNQTQPSAMLEMSNIITRMDSQYSHATKKKSRQTDMFAQNTSLTNMDEQSTSVIHDQIRINSMQTSFVKLQKNLNYRCNSVGKSSLTSPRRQPTQSGTQRDKFNTSVPNQDQAPTSIINLTTANLTTKPDEDNLSLGSSENQMELKNEQTAAFEDQIENEHLVDSNNQRHSLPYFISESHNSESPAHESSNKIKSENTFGSPLIDELKAQSPQQIIQRKQVQDKPVYVSFQKGQSGIKNQKGSCESQNLERKKVINTGNKMLKKK